MYKWIFALIATTAFAAPFKIDLAHPSAKIQSHFSTMEPLEYCGFNSAPEIAQFIHSLKTDYAIDVAIETGTYLGETTRFLADCFNEVHTIEISDVNLNKALKALKDKDNVQAHLGSSEIVLHNLLPALKDKRAIFYLDAHWNEFWPLLDELREIGKTHKDNCIIVIDDFKVPGRKDLKYDKYGPHSCSYRYIENALSQVFTEYDYYYIIPKNAKSRAKFLAIPRKWQTNPNRICQSKFDLASQFLKRLAR